MITVNTNMSSIIAQNSLYKSTNKMNTALQRLSTGLRINSAKDDAAGSAISTKLEYKVSSYDVAKDNAQMGQSMLDTANSTLSKVNSMLQRMRDLSEQAANGTYGDDERKAMQSEIDALTEEIYRIKNTTEFNGKKILGEEESQKQTMTSVPTMSMSDVSEANWDSTENQIIGISSLEDLVKMQQLLNKGCASKDRTFALTNNIDLSSVDNWEPIGSITNYNSRFKGTFDGNGFTISNLNINSEDNTTNGWGFFGAPVGATIKNITFENANIIGYKYVGVISGANYDTNFENCNVKNSIIKGETVVGGLVGELNGSKTVTMSNCSIDNSIIDSAGTIVSGLSGFSNERSIIQDCYASCKFKTSNSFNMITHTNAGTKVLNCFYNNKTNSTIPKDVDYYNIKNSDFNPFIKNNTIDTKTNLQVGIDSSENSQITIDTGFSLGDFKISVSNEIFARMGLDKIDSLMAKITDKLTDIGSTQNRLMSTMEFQELQRQALTSANSLIKDADIALESANYIKNQILQSVTSSILATANQNPQIALQLI